MTDGNPVPARLSWTDKGRHRRRDIDGIVLLDKPSGLSSNQALQRVKWLFNARKAGHTGSLDPLASGMLPVCLGQATKVSAFLLGADKVYRVKAFFGVQTATGDAEGRATEVGPDAVGEAELERALARFRGAVSQTPPMYSALKHQGRRLYELAREGREVPREPRMVAIHEFALEAYHAQTPILRVRCSKGTYIRSLVEDLARAAGTVGHVAELRRLVVEPFPEGSMRTLPNLEAAAEAGADVLERVLVQADEALRIWPAVYLDGPAAIRIRQGLAISCDLDQPTGMVRLYGEAGHFLGMGECLADRRIRPRRLMATSDSRPERYSGL